jgi:DNA-binding winged helix-turn-helix (wHTH) protein
MQARFSDFVLDTDTRELTRGSRAVHLSRKAFQLLALLVTSRPHALSKEKLYQHLWPNTFVVEANLSNLIGELRAALGDDPRRPEFIRTVHGFGYAFREASGNVTAAGELRSTTIYQLVWEGGRATVGEGEHVLGRDPNLELCVDSPSVSRCHARLRIRGGEAVLEDLASKNGTFVNGKRITTATLISDRDQLRVGSVHIKFTVRRTQPSTETTGMD